MSTSVSLCLINRISAFILNTLVQEGSQCRVSVIPSFPLMQLSFSHPPLLLLKSVPNCRETWILCSCGRPHTVDVCVKPCNAYFYVCFPICIHLLMENQIRFCFNGLSHTTVLLLPLGKSVPDKSFVSSPSCRNSK